MTHQPEAAALGRDAIRSLVFSSLQDVLTLERYRNQGRPEATEHIHLMGPDGLLDSLGLVALLADVEQRLEEEFDLVVTLADQRAMSRERSPFRTVDSLTDYVLQLAGEER